MAAQPALRTYCEPFYPKLRTKVRTCHCPAYVMSMFMGHCQIMRAWHTPCNMSLRRRVTVAESRMGR